MRDRLEPMFRTLLSARRRDETTKTIVDITGGAAWGGIGEAPDRQRLIGRCEAWESLHLKTAPHEGPERGDAVALLGEQSRSGERLVTSTSKKEVCD